MTTITLDKAQFRERFPAFASTTTYPDGALDVQWLIAVEYISAEVYGCLSASGRALALQLMLAHLLALADAIAANGTNKGTPGITVGATIDKVSVTLAQPPFGTSQWRYWLNLTPYGTQLLALLQARSVGGFYIGGSPTRAAFRGPGGAFNG